MARSRRELIELCMDVEIYNPVEQSWDEEQEIRARYEKMDYAELLAQYRKFYG